MPECRAFIGGEDSAGALEKRRNCLLLFRIRGADTCPLGNPKSPSKFAKLAARAFSVFGGTLAHELGDCESPDGDVLSASPDYCFVRKRVRHADLAAVKLHQHSRGGKSP
jgi:hypothetical protein